MVMKNSDYWIQRFEILEQSAVNRGQAYLSILEREYRTASARIESELSAWYNRFAANNSISLSEARRMLTTKELAEFRWSVQDYIKFGEQNAMNPQWMKQLENASARVHVSRLESLQLQMQQQIEVLYGNQTDGIDALARKIYSEGYYHTAYEIQRGFNVGWDLQGIDHKQLDRVISKPWTADNRTFRDKCWTQKAELVSTVQTELTQAIMRGDSPDKAIKTISDKFGVAKSKAGRLVMTESAYFASEAQEKCFKELNVEQFEIVATLDSHTSQICQDLDGLVFPMASYQPGVTAPPFHPWCRTTTVPYFEDNYGERAARGADGKTYYVPSDMKYAEWKKSFADGGSKEGLQEVGIGDILKGTSIADCKSVEEINDFVLNKLKPYGVEKVDFTGMNLDVAKANGEELIRLQEKYKNSLTAIQASNTMGKNTYAHVMRVGKDEHCVMEFSNSFFSNPDRLTKSFLSDVKSGFHPAGMDAHSMISIATHEFGHTFASATQRKWFGWNDDFWKEIESIKRKYSRALNSLEKQWYTQQVFNPEGYAAAKAEIFISEYAKKNVDEFLAEAFSMAELSDSPSPYAKDVLEVVEKYFLRGD